jgi:hypothetical protein
VNAFHARARRIDHDCLVATKPNHGPTHTERAFSGGAGQHDRLSWAIDGEQLDCDFQYELEAPLPDGLLFIPRAMEDKWVIGFKPGRIAGARSWTGETLWLAEARQDASKLRVSKLILAPQAGLASFGDPRCRVVAWLERR